MRFARLLAVVFFTLSSGGVAVPAQPGALDAFLAKIRAAGGAPYRFHVVSRARETIDGRVFETKSEAEGMRYRVRRCAKEICSGFYFDGERSFNTNINDTALPLSLKVDGFQVTLRAISSNAFAAPDFRAGGGHVAELEPVKSATKQLRRLSIAASRGSVLDALIDPETNLITAVTSVDGRNAFAFRDYRKIAGGVTLPFEILLNGRRVEHFDERTVEDGPMRAPAGVTPKFEAGAVTVKMLRGGKTGEAPVVDCTVGGATVPCLLDTGNSGLSISLELAERLGIEPTGAFSIRGIGQYMTGVAKIGALHIGSLTYAPASYLVLHDVHPYGYDVVLGADAFAHARVTLDYGKREVTFEPADAPSPATTIPFSFENYIPVVPVRLGALEVPLAVDTGDESTINLSYDFYEIHPSLFKVKERTTVGGIGGSSEALMGEIPSVRVADLTVERQRISATKRLQATGKGHLGAGFLSHFTAVFDYRRSRLGLIPRPGDSAVSGSDAR